MEQGTKNRYIFYRNDQHQINFDFDPVDPCALDEVGYKYFGRVLHALDPLIKDQGFTICVSAWTVHELPVYGPKVISCLMQDEWAREVHYRDKIGAVFRTCGRFPVNFQSYKFGGLGEKISNFLAQGRALAEDKTGRLNSALARLKGRTLAPIYEMPIGYFAREEIDFIPVYERANDMYFAGSMQHQNNKKVQIKRPKEYARRRMEDALAALAKEQPDLHINTKVTSGYGESVATDNQGYLQNMMNTKICPIPRGANLETYRFFEAIRYGCIPVGEAFPKGWFYDDAPILRLNDWSELKDVVPRLLADKQRLEVMHKEVLSWWDDICDEKALAAHMASKLSQIHKGGAV